VRPAVLEVLRRSCSLQAVDELTKSFPVHSECDCSPAVWLNRTALCCERRFRKLETHIFSSAIRKIDSSVLLISSCFRKKCRRDNVSSRPSPEASNLLSTARILHGRDTVLSDLPSGRAVVLSDLPSGRAVVLSELPSGRAVVLSDLPSGRAVVLSDLPSGRAVVVRLAVRPCCSTVRPAVRPCCSTVRPSVRPCFNTVRCAVRPCCTCSSVESVSSPFLDCTHANL
jgi:hypothetical protein